ncbi:MAG: hypothetical protein GY787_24610 [Alteromonadales bacterium]|nr:hypothetical protein [Alteromonadales bacterium]
MNYTILTQNSMYTLSSDYIKHMYPSNKLFKSCNVLSNEDVKKIRFKELGLKTFSGSLKVLANTVNGSSRKQNLLKAFDRGIARSDHKASLITERDNWKGNYSPRATVPQSYKSARAPISAGTSLNKKTTTRGGVAMAVGIIIEAARAALLYSTIRDYLAAFSQKTHTKNPNSIGAVFTVTIIYLKVETSYGKAPVFGGVYLAKLISPSDDFYASEYVNVAINNICKPKFQATEEKIISININDLDHPNMYETATLFVKCDW